MGKPKLGARYTHKCLTCARRRLKFICPFSKVVQALSESYENVTVLIGGCMKYEKK